MASSGHAGIRRWGDLRPFPPEATVLETEQGVLRVSIKKKKRACLARTELRSVPRVVRVTARASTQPSTRLHACIALP